MTDMDATPHEENPVEDVTLKDVFVQLNSMRREMDSSFTMVNRDMEEMRHELRHDMKNSMKKYKKLEGHWMILGWRSKTQNPIWRRPAKT